MLSVVGGLVVAFLGPWVARGVQNHEKSLEVRTTLATDMSKSFTMAVVDADERTATAGITNVARTGSAAIAPTFAGMAFSAAALGLPFFISGALKIVYDVAIYFTFRNVHPPEERERHARRVAQAAAKTTT